MTDKTGVRFTSPINPDEPFKEPTDECRLAQAICDHDRKSSRASVCEHCDEWCPDREHRQAAKFILSHPGVKFADGHIWIDLTEPLTKYFRGG